MQETQEGWNVLRVTDSRLPGTLLQAVCRKELLLVGHKFELNNYIRDAPINCVVRT